MFRFPRLWATLVAIAMAGCADSGAGTGDTTVSYKGDRIGHFGFGTPATPEQIAGWDIDIRPDGAGLPEGSGSVEDGEWLYEEQCAECHGSFGEGVGRYPILAGGQGSLKDERPTRSVGSYWPYTSTLFDYIYRAMPFTMPESLSVDETYAVTAYVLYLNDLVEDDLVLDHTNLASIRLPNEPNFVPDPRPDVANTRCMNDCRDPAQVNIISEVAPAAPLPQVSVTETETTAAHHPGRQTYDQFCGICHRVGVGGAPITGDTDAWSERITNRAETLATNAIDGVSSGGGSMPPKGGFMQLTDDEVRAAVDYMVGESS